MIRTTSDSADHVEASTIGRTPLLVACNREGWVAVWRPGETHATIVHHPKTPGNIGRQICVAAAGRPDHILPGLRIYTGRLTLESVTVAKPKAPDTTGQTTTFG